MFKGYAPPLPLVPQSAQQQAAASLETGRKPLFDPRQAVDLDAPVNGGPTTGAAIVPSNTKLYWVAGGLLALWYFTKDKS